METEQQGATWIDGCGVLLTVNYRYSRDVAHIWDWAD